MSVEKCSCEAPQDNIMILACSGGSNVGQLSNQAAVELTVEGFGKMYCLAGIGGRLGGFVQSAKDAPAMIVIDGCEIGCAKATLQSAGVPLGAYLVITTDLGIQKNKNFNLSRDDIEKVKNAVKSLPIKRSKSD
ncbi:MAG: putative zinc-binding protein [Thermodesulforhabdaceae bacterium]|jgi:uncharacterized metal-binding protein